VKNQAAGDEGEQVRFASALNLLRLVRHKSDAIGVAVSFGKDSLATLDLACRVFKRVEGYYLYRVAGLEIVDEWAAQVKARHGVTVRMYPHFDLARCYRNAVLQPHWRGLDKTAAIKMADIETSFRADAAVDWIAYGWRRNDSFSRALIMRKCAGFDPASRRVFPLRSWRRQDVYAYLDARGIPRPPKLGRKEQGGLDFHPAALAGLSESDWQKWERDFPFSGMQRRRALADESETDAPADRISASP
jgi:3'-phosphoadenosine 5'-phosphosulfate sulfotransferase (PAPS reductase)/FAD synthetase